MAKKYIAANSLQPTDRQKVRQYIDIINNYEACPGAATLALRMLWELVFAYQNAKPDGEPIIKAVSIDDKNDNNKSKFINRENTTPAEYETFLLISSCCHYQEDHDSLTQEGRKIRFKYLIAKSKEPICNRFKNYASEPSCEEAMLLNSLLVMFDKFSQNAPAEWPRFEDVSESSVEYEEHYIDRICSEYSANIETLLANIYYLRYIPEMILHKKAKEANPDIKKTDLSDFIDIFRSGKYRDSQLYDLANRTEIFSRMLNFRFHWFYTENTQYNEESERREISNVRPLLAEILTQTLAEKADMPAVSRLIQTFQGNNQGHYAGISNYLLESLRGLEQEHAESISTVEQMKEKKKKEDRANTIMLVFLVVVLVGMVLWAYFTFLPHSGDPNPRIRETIDSAAGWLETPSVSVYIAGTEAEQNEALVLYANGEPTLIQVDAVCNGEYSLKYSQSERLANRYDYAVNPFGLSKLQYQLYSLGYDETTDMSMGRYSLPVGSGSASFNQELLPGWYCLSVQAVGAGDGITQNDNELVASTGWINYYILVLPADENAEWTLHNRSTNSYAAAKDGLSIQEGQSLVVNCDTTIQEGLNLYYAWDSNSWVKFDSNTEIEVPSMEAGLHTLNLRACYVYNEAIVVESFTNSFSCMFEAPSLPECNVELTVLGPDGTMIQDRSTVIVEPGDQISVSSYGRYGISRLEWYGEYQDGTVNEGNSHQSSSMTITLGGEYGEGTRTLYITAIGTGDGGLEDQMNRKQLSINLLYRTHEDEYDADGNVTKEWLYNTPSSNEPTGYIETYKYDDEGQELDWAYFTVDGKPTYDGQYGCHRIAIEYTEDGWEGWAYDLDGITPMEGTNVFGEWADGAAGKTYREFENESSIECWTSYFGADKKPYLGLRRIASHYQIWDKNGNCLEQFNYDENGNPVLNSDGWFHLVQEYNSNNKLTYKAFFDTEGHPCHGVDGYHRVELSYDDYGNTISEISYYADGSAVVNDGYSKYVKAFLPGTDIEESCEYRDEYDTPVVNTSLGYSRIEREYLNGVLERVSLYDEKNSPVNCHEGYASIEYINDPLYTVSSYKDAAGDLVIPKNGYWAKCEKHYDIDGNLTETIYYADETTLTGRNGIWSPAREKYQYNNDGKKVAEYYYDHEDNPIPMNDTNYCGLSYIYDLSDDSTYYVYYLDENENRILNESGFYMAKKTEDENGNTIREERFLQDGSMPTGDTIRRIEWTFNEAKITSKIEYTEPRIDAISQTVRTYDNNENLSSIAYYDGNGSPIEDEYGVQKYTYNCTFDEEAKITTVHAECLDDRSHLTIGPDGYAAIEVKYSEEEEPDYIMTREGFRVGEWWFGSESYLEVHYIGTNEKDMVNTKAGYAAYRKESSATQSVEEFYDQAGSLLYVENLGYAKLIRDYENSNMTQWAFYGADGLLCLNHYGFAMEKWSYDENDNEISHSFHDTQKQLMLNEYGTYALNESIYKDDHLVYDAYKDVDENLMINPDRGYAVFRRELHDGTSQDKYYDEYGILIDTKS